MERRGHCDGHLGKKRAYRAIITGKKNKIKQNSGGVELPISPERIVGVLILESQAREREDGAYRVENLKSKF